MNSPHSDSHSRILRRTLPLWLPLAAIWARMEEKLVLRRGVALEEPFLADAAAMGVSHPERIRLLKVNRVPLPRSRLLYAIGKMAGLSSDTTTGMSVRYGIFIRSEFWGNRHLIAHECVHTAQYERLGGMRPFLNLYLRECLDLGYLDSPLEQEARRRSAEIPA